MESPKINFRAVPPLDRELDARTDASAGLTAQRDLLRYYDLLALALREADLTLAEANAIADANNGTGNIVGDTITPRYAWANVADSPGLGGKWNIDQDALVAKMRAWDPLRAVAVADAVERFWTAVGRDGDAEIADYLSGE